LPGNVAQSFKLVLENGLILNHRHPLLYLSTFGFLILQNYD